MCTVTFIARRNGYALGMNRDEKLDRPLALPPKRHRLANRHALFPSEPNGGTWIGVNDAGASLALINWYYVPAPVAKCDLSRGLIVKSAFSADRPTLVTAALAALPLSRIKPFRLIGFFPLDKSVVEWRWNLQTLESVPHPWRTNIWISSGYDEPGAQRTRGKVFRHAFRQTSAGTLPWLRRLHQSHAPEIGPYSICMHRDEATTISYTEVCVSPRTGAMRYCAGAPCCSPAIHLDALRLA